MKKLLLSFILLPLFLVFVSPAFADYSGTFTANNVSFDGNTLSFDLSDISPTLDPDNHIFNQNQVQLWDATDREWVSNSVSLTCVNDGHCSATGIPDVGNYSNDVRIAIYLDDGLLTSQFFNVSEFLPVQIYTNPSSYSATVGTPFNVEVKVGSGGNAFNAARASVVVSSNLSITGIHNATSNSCNLQYTETPTTSNPSFAGAIFGGSSTGCAAYTMTLTPTSTGTGTITFTNGSVKAYSDNSEIMTGVTNASFTLSDGPTPTPTPSLDFTITNVLLTYHSSFNLTGTKLAALTHMFVNGSDADSTYPTSTTWENTQSLSLGDNNFTLYGTDDSNNQTATQTIDVNRHKLGDINGDGNVDLIDASLFAVDWDKTSNLTYNLSDMNDDGNVDLTDLSILAKLIE